MKRILTLLFAAMLAGQAWAATTFTIGNLKYTVTDETNHYVSVGKGSTAPTGALSIPSTVINGSTTYAVTSIGNGAFEYCSSLTTVIIPNSVTSIGDGAFYSCSGLTAVSIPESVTSIGSYPFQNCSNLKDINVGSSNTAYTSENGVLFNKAKNNLICYPAGKTETTYTIPNSVTSIGSDAFSGCSGLTSVTIPNSVTSIGSCAFIDCSGLTSIAIPNSVTSISDHVFYGCSGLASVTIPNSVTSIGYSAFCDCSGLTSVTIPNSVKSISDYAFYSCSGLTSVTIGNSVTSIGNSAFCDCNGLTSVTIPNSVKSISGYAFRGCSGLTSVTIPNSVTSIGNYAFSRCSGLTEVTIPESVTSINDCAFAYCSGLTTVTIPNSVTSIGNGMFYGCSGLITVIIPKSIASIGQNAFYGCTGIMSICYEGSSEPTFKSSSFENVATTIPVCVPMNYASNSWCGFQVSKHNLVTIPATLATCTESGLSEGRSCTCCNKVLIAQTSMPALGHSYGSPTYVWADNGSTCTATTVCQRNENHVANENATITNEVTTAATCEGEGTTTYTATFENELFSTQTKAIENILALGHSYGTPAYAWAEDGSTCSATAICQRDESHVATENATITSAVTTAATCEGKGTTTYTATFENELFSTQTKAVVDIPALGHNYGTPAYAWAEDGSTCTATKVCANDSEHVVTETVNATSVVTEEATCEEVGTRTFTAEFTEESFATQQTTEDIAALGHSYSAPTYAWSNDNSTCTATKVCANDSEHIVTETVNATSVVTEEATCEEVGTRTFTAEFTEEGFATQQTTEDIAATGHTAAKAVAENYKAPTCTAVGSVDSVVYCSVCKNQLSRKTVEVAATGHTEIVDAAVAATCTTDGKTEGKHCSTCNAVIVEQTEVAALGHKFEKYTYNNDATSDADGTKTAICERGCGATDTKVAEGTKLPEKATAVSDKAANAVSIYAHNNIIVVENATEEISVYDAMGQLICRDVACRIRAEINVNAPGVYIVKTGNVTKRVYVE